ncbi:MAG: methyltransferase domain-containing protein [Candidatus Aegiribacteria sp.]
MQAQSGGLKAEEGVWERYAPLFCFEEREVFTPDIPELEFYRNIRRRFSGSCVELGAGDGRLTRHLAEGDLTVALEPSAAMLAAWRGGDAFRVRGVAQRIPLRRGSMELVLFPYNGIHCILRRSERRRALKEAAELLAPRGVFLAEACPQFLDREDEELAERYGWTGGGKSLRLVESVSHDGRNCRIVFDMVYTGSVVPEGRTEVRLELALISAGELLSDIRSSGMRVLSVWGDYDLSPWDGDSSPRLLVMAGRLSS